MDPLMGQITLFAGNFAPRNWAFCDGQLLAISQNSALFSILGTTYGGDGRTTFALPDLRGRAPIHAGTGPGLSNRQLGSRSGEEYHTLSIIEMPSHNHLATSASKLRGLNSNGDDNIVAPGASLAGGAEIYNTSSAPNTELNDGSVITTTNILNQGGNQGHNNMQPYLTINYIIALVGIFPSRN